jgi:integrase
LRTTDKGTARRLSRTLYVCTEDLFDAVRNAPMLSELDIAAMVKEFYTSVLEQDEAVRLMRDMPIPEGLRAHYVEHYSQLAERGRADLASGAYGSVRLITNAMLARRFGSDFSLDKADARRASHAMLRAGIEVAETLKARAEGNFNYEPQDKVLIAALQEPTEPALPVGTSEQAMPPAPRAAGPAFSQEAETFRQAQLRRKVWEQQTALQARKTYAMFTEFFGDKPLAQFTRRDAARFKELLEDLPASYGKAAEYRGMQAAQIVEMTRTLEVARLSPRTVQRHFAALSALWASAIEHERADTNIFADWKFAASKRARDQRQMWEKDELRALFATPVWTGCQSAHRRSKPGTVILRDEKFWLPLIAVFSGMRQEEICQLRLADVRPVEGIWVFDLNTRTGQQLKNANAIRQVPIHSELIRLGLLAYADEQKVQGKDLLFSNLQPGGADDRLGHNYSKWFSRYRRETGLFVTGRDFHSFRHSATTFMSRAGVQHTVIDAVTGHATAGETARYDKGLTVANLKAAVETIDIGVDLSPLHLPAIQAP